MSGHSKWSTIKRQKQHQDAMRGQVFTKLANAITMAVAEGAGVDPTSNFKLRLAIDKARSANMPKDNIDRALARGAGKGKDGVELSEGLYEGFGPGGAAILATVVTDNKNRTQNTIRMVFDKGGGRLASTGAALHLFDQIGMVVVPTASYSLDDVLSYAIEAGADDVVPEGEAYSVYTKPAALHAAGQYFAAKGIVVHEVSLGYRPKDTISLDHDVQEKLTKLLEALEDIDEVHEVFTNATFTSL